MREQVYKDPRPAEHFARFHKRARTRKPDWVYGVVRFLTTVYGMVAFRARGIRVDRVPREGPLILAPEPLLVHGPLLRGHVHPAAGPVHGQVAALQAPDAVGLHARRRLPGAPRPRRPGGVHHGRGDPRARRLRGDVLRGRALTDGRAGRASAARYRQARAAIGRHGRAGRDLRLAAGAQLEAPAIPAGHRLLRRADRPSSTRRTPAGSASRRSPTRSSARSSSCMRRSTTRRASCARRPGGAPSAALTRGS